MSKLIQLPNGPYIPADSIIEVKLPCEYGECWYYNIMYKLTDKIETHIAVLHNETFINTQEKANKCVESFVERVNKSL